MKGTFVLQKLKMEGEFKTALPVLKKLKEAGYEAYFVGGSVRDALLGLEVNDVDIATSAYPEEVKQIFSKTVDVGVEHGTVMVLYQGESYEVTTFRTESTYQDFRRPDSVTFVRSLKEDLKRRDFTINAFAIDETGEIHDYFNGEADLHNQVLRAVGVPDERFNEDALRMMRGVRFASQLGFTIEEETKLAITRHAQLLQHIAVERTQVEFVKLLLGKEKKLGIDAFIDTALYQYCPGLSSEKEALDKLAQLDVKIETEALAWTLVCYFIGEKLSVQSFLKKWKTSNKMIQTVNQLLQGLRKRIEETALNSYQIYLLGEEAALEVETLMDYLGFVEKKDEVKELYNALPIHSKEEIQLTGHDLMKATDAKPGKWMSEALNEVEKQVVLGKIKNEKDIILSWLEQEEKIPKDKK
jgi:tRNA nucleotidyltransferase (CCA-adding enzyme)